MRFTVTDITDDTIVGGMPVNDLLALNVGNVTTGPAAPPGVPGVVGALVGTIPLPIEVTTPTQFEVTVDVRWRVTDENGDVIDDVEWSLAGMPVEADTGGAIAPTFGRAMDALSLVFGLGLVEHIGVDAPTVQRTLSASIGLMAGGVSSDWVDLPPVPLTLPAIPVPTIAIFCQDKSFDDNKLVVVPETSPFDEDTIEGAFSDLKDVVGPLESTFSFLSLFVSQAGLVADLLSSSSVTFRKTNEVSNLNNILRDAVERPRPLAGHHLVRRRVLLDLLRLGVTTGTLVVHLPRLPPGWSSTWTIRAGDTSGPPGARLQTPAGPTTVHVAADVWTLTWVVRGSIVFAVNVAADGVTTVRVPALAVPC